MNTPPDVSAEQNPCRATITHELAEQTNKDEIEVELASPWKRIGAVFINAVLVGIAFVPSHFFFLIHIPSDDAFFLSSLLTILLLLLLAIWQIRWMTKSGQSIGKRVLAIKVIMVDGQNPGWVGTVLLREIVFYLVAGIMFTVMGILWAVFYAIVGHPIGQNVTRHINDTIIWIMFYYFPYFICLIMLFRPQASRRTLQDYLAKTLVVKA